MTNGPLLSEADSPGSARVATAVRFKLICRVFSVIKRNEEYEKDYGKIAA